MLNSRGEAFPEERPAIYERGKEEDVQKNLTFSCASLDEQGESNPPFPGFPLKGMRTNQIVKECWAGILNDCSEKENILYHHPTVTHPFPNIFRFELLVLFPLKVWNGGPSCQTPDHLCSGLWKKILFPVLCFLAAASGSTHFLVSQCLFPPQTL